MMLMLAVHLFTAMETVLAIGGGVAVVVIAALLVHRFVRSKAHEEALGVVQLVTPGAGLEDAPVFVPPAEQQL